MKTQYEGVFFVAKLEARQLNMQRGIESWASVYVHICL